METSQGNDQAGGAKPANKPSIDSLRTVEFRTTLRGYHMDDVDEYLERVAVEAEALQEQMRLASERVKQAGERVSTLEQQLEQARKIQQSAPVTEAVERVEITDDSLQRTLLLAQKFVDQTRQQAEDEANSLVSESEARARSIVADAEEHVRVLTEDAERNLREEVKRLDTLRAELVGDVETIARHLETERARIRKALTDMVAWVDEHVQPPKSVATHQGMERKVNPSGGNERTSSQSRPDSAPARTRPAPQLQADPRETEGSSSPVSASTAHEGTDEPGQPTERIRMARGATAGRLDPDDPSDLLDAVPTPEPAAGLGIRQTPGHQRQMFAPGRDSHQSGRGAVR